MLVILNLYLGLLSQPPCHQIRPPGRDRPSVLATGAKCYVVFPDRRFYEQQEVTFSGTLSGSRPNVDQLADTVLTHPWLKTYTPPV